MALTTKQRLFVQFYLESYNATQAAIRAGYTPNSARTTAWRMLKNADIREHVSQHIEIEGMGAIERLFTLSTIARDTEQRTGDRLRAIEMLGKLNGDYIEKSQAQNNETIQVAIVYSDENNPPPGPRVFIPDNGRD